MWIYFTFLVWIFDLSWVISWVFLEQIYGFILFFSYDSLLSDFPIKAIFLLSQLFFSLTVRQILPWWWWVIWMVEASIEMQESHKVSLFWFLQLLVLQQLSPRVNGSICFRKFSMGCQLYMPIKEIEAKSRSHRCGGVSFLVQPCWLLDVCGTIRHLWVSLPFSKQSDSWWCRRCFSLRIQKREFLVSL